MGSSLFVVATLLLAVVGSSCGDGVPQYLSFMKATMEPYACSTGKLSCSNDCKTIQVCLGGTLEDVKKCPDDLKCDAVTMTCKKAEEAECGVMDPDKFGCRGPVGGRFPNPNDCHSYFECPEPPPADSLASKPRLENGAKHDCPDKLAYDALSTTCRFKETHRVCKEGPVPACKAQLQMGPLIENPNIYYVCVSVGGVLQPWLAKCSDPTTVFEDGQCVDSSYLWL